MSKKEIEEITAEEIAEQYKNADPDQDGQDEGEDLLQIDEKEED